MTPTASGDTINTHPRWAPQESLQALGRPLRDVTFCVVDLETTGPAPGGGDRITEIGAVKVRGGEVLGEFQTLVNPDRDIPAFIAVLTGISNSMVSTSPRINSVLPAFIEFAAGSVLVAHNAPFDVGFLRTAATELDIGWPDFEVLDTVKLARHVVTKDEAPNHKLGTLARVFRTETTPNHRALADARATVDVLHGLIGRLGNLGVTTVEELTSYSSKAMNAQRRKRHLADPIPHAPGVYLFRDEQDRVLYVGTSKDLRTRVRSYFTAAETRSRIGEMVQIATRVDHVVCATPLEASVRELRLIARHKPPYNRRSKFPEKTYFLKLTDEAWPRLTIVRQVTDGATYLGPFGTRKSAAAVQATVHDTFPIRQCTSALKPSAEHPGCVLAEMGRCLAPCNPSVLSGDYQDVVDAVRSAMAVDPSKIRAAETHRMDRASDREDYEAAAVHRDRMIAYEHALRRAQHLESLARISDLVAARRTDDGRWELHVIRHGRLAGAAVIPMDVDARRFARQVRDSAETVADGPGPVPAASEGETRLILDWLRSDGCRLVHLDGTWSLPIHP